MEWLFLREITMKFILLGIERMTGTLAHLYDSVIIIGAIIGKIIDFISEHKLFTLPSNSKWTRYYQDHCHALSILFNVPATIYTRKEEGKGEVSFGLVPGHAYSLIAVKKLSNGAQLVCVSNPSCSTLPLLTSLHDISSVLYRLILLHKTNNRWK